VSDPYRNLPPCEIDEDEEIVDSVTLDFDAIPDFIKHDLAQAALEGFMSFIRRPDAQSILEAEREKLRLEGSALLDRFKPKTKKGVHA
jgi:hypothetical protein